ncbi:MAG: DUF6062 family protein [Bacillota bacterium]
MSLVEAELREALRLPGCALCRLEHLAEQTYCTWFILENYYSAATLEVLNRGGFCRVHAWRMAQLAGQRLAATYDVLVREAKERVRRALAVSTGAGSPVRWRARRWQAVVMRVLERKEPCPVCVASVRRAELGARHLVQFLEQEAGRDDYTRSDGLCWDHLVRVCLLAEPPVASFLLNDFLRRLSALEASLAEYFRKSDYRFAHEPKGPEQTAYLDAVELFSGLLDRVGGVMVPGRTKLAGRGHRGA